MPKKTTNNEQYTLKDGRVVKLGDIVKYKWGSFPTGYVIKIQKKFGRWRLHVQLFNYQSPYDTFEIKLCHFDHFFSFVEAEEDLKNESG